MEKLTKQQIVLVTLLVSFVTSIATGVVTVALMDQAPAGVTQTINRIVERTIEKVVEPSQNNTAAVATKETVIVKEEDKIMEAVDKNKDSIVRIYTNVENAGDVEQRAFIGLGTIVSKDGLIMTGDAFMDQRGKFLATFDNNNFYKLTILPKKENSQLYFLKIVLDEKKPLVFTPVVFADSNNLRIGQTVIAWGGKNQNSIFTGIISSLIENINNVATTSGGATSSTNARREILAINTNINPNDSISGGPLINLNGEIIGLRVGSNISSLYSYFPSNVLKQEISAVASR